MGNGFVRVRPPPVLNYNYYGSSESGFTFTRFVVPWGGNSEITYSYSSAVPPAYVASELVAVSSATDAIAVPAQGSSIVPLTASAPKNSTATVRVNFDNLDIFTVEDNPRCLYKDSTVNSNGVYDTSISAGFYGYVVWTFISDANGAVTVSVAFETAPNHFYVQKTAPYGVYLDAALIDFTQGGPININYAYSNLTPYSTDEALALGANPYPGVPIPTLPDSVFPIITAKPAHVDSTLQINLNFNEAIAIANLAVDYSGGGGYYQGAFNQLCTAPVITENGASSATFYLTDNYQVGISASSMAP